MTDSERLSTRLDGVVSGRRAAKKTNPDLQREIQQTVRGLLRKHVVDPSKVRPATDQELADKDAADVREWRAAKAERLLTRIPARYRTAGLHRTQQGDEARQWLREFRSGNQRSMIIMGPPGTGKTWMACAIAIQLMDPDRPVPCIYTTTAEMLDSLRGPTRPGLDVDMTLYQGTPVLILDDFGAELLTDWGREVLYRLAHSRDHNGLPTIVTTNLKGEEIHARYEARTVQRLFSGAVRIDLDGESRRDLPI